MNDADAQRLTAREWLAMRIVVFGGFAIAIAVAGYVSWSQHAQDAAQRAHLNAMVHSIAAKNTAALETERKRVGAMLCLRVLINAQDIGIVPVYGRLTNYMPHMIGSQGRYACSAGTDVAKYSVTGDLICRNMKDAKCVKLVTVKLDDGTVLYSGAK